MDETATISLALLISLGGFLCTIISTRSALKKDSDSKGKLREEQIRNDTVHNTRIDTKLERIAIDTSDIRSSIDTLTKKIDDHEKRLTYIEMKEKFKEESKHDEN